MGHNERHAELQIVDNVTPAMAALLQASLYAFDTDSQLWDFAISMRRLVDLGASETDLRWLVKKGFVEHGREVTVEGDHGREFRSTGNLTFSRQTCFVLTQSGIEAAQYRCNSPNSNRGGSPGRNGQPKFQLQVAMPQWDSEARRLHMADQLVKHFKWPAANQEAVLCAFQEEGWPERVDDPLPPKREQDSKRRLADTIKCLNRKQLNELVHFRGDGTGEGVVWERNGTKGNVTSG